MQILQSNWLRFLLFIAWLIDIELDNNKVHDISDRVFRLKCLNDVAGNVELFY